MDLSNLILIKDSTGADDEVYIGRAGHGFDGYFGNPVKIGKICPICNNIHIKAGDTLPCYELYLIKKIQTDTEFRRKLKDLNNKKLMCFCKNKTKCHGSIMIKQINVLNNKGFYF